MGFLGHQSIENFVPIEAIVDDLWYNYKEQYKYCYNIKDGTTKEYRIRKEEFAYQPSLRTLDGMEPRMLFTTLEYEAAKYGLRFL